MEEMEKEEPNEQQIQLQQLMGGFLELSALVHEGGTDLQRQFHHLAQGFSLQCEQLQLQLFQKDTDVQKKFEALLALVQQMAQALHTLQGRDHESQIFQTKLVEYVNKMTQHIEYLQNNNHLQYLTEWVTGLNEKASELYQESMPEAFSRIYACEQYIEEQKILRPPPVQKLGHCHSIWRW